MNENHTFAIIKPDAVEHGNSAEILYLINSAGYKINALKMTSISIKEAEKFYAIHKDREFFVGLTQFMSSGPIVAMILEKDDAVHSFRKFIGSTDPAAAVEGTIRKRFGTNTRFNAIHASDSVENARHEAGYFFSEREIF